jgi:ElaB protein
MKHTASTERILGPFIDLTDSVDDLLQQISELKSPEIQKIRTKVQIALAAAQSAWRDTASYAGRQAMQTLRRPDEYVHESPWQALGIATLLGLGLGAMLTWPARTRER